MNDDELVTLEVRASEDQVRRWADNLPDAHTLKDPARAWVAANDRPERRRFRLLEQGPNPPNDRATAVAVEDLRPGDRVAGREVNADPWPISHHDDGASVGVSFTDGSFSTAFPGSLVVLDGDR